MTNLIGFDSNISTITSGVPQGSVLGPLLFLINIYINDLNVAIKHCKVHHFADDTNLLNINKSPKHKFINIDLKNLTKWLNANKISLNVLKTEMVLFRPKRKSMNFTLKIKLNGKQLYDTNSVKYLGIRIDHKLNWKAHINDIALKLITLIKKLTGV